MSSLYSQITSQIEIKLGINPLVFRTLLLRMRMTDQRVTNQNLSIYSFSSQLPIVHFRNLIFSQCKIGLFLFTFHAFGPHPSNSTFGTLSVHGVTCPDTVFRTGVSTSDTVLSFRTYHIYKKIRETLIRCFLGANLCITVYTILLNRF